MPLCLLGPLPSPNLPPAPGGEQHQLYANGKDSQQDHACSVPEDGEGTLRGLKEKEALRAPRLREQSLGKEVDGFWGEREGPEL